MVACSLIYDLDTTQCARTADCEALGADFEGTICQSGLCVLPASSTGGGGGSDGTGGTGEGGAPPECLTNKACMDAAFGTPSICRAGKCVELPLGTDCPLVLGAGDDNENLIDGDPIIIGAYSYVKAISPLQSAPTLNYKLAIEEFNDRTLGGLPGGTNGKLRPIVAVVCAGSDSPNLDASSRHLVQTLGVPAIISSIYSNNLLQTFFSQGKPNGILFLSPLGADSTLATADDDGLLWHLLGSSEELAPILKPLVAKVEEHVRNVNGLPADENLRVALVEAKTPFQSDLADFAYGSVTYNGISAKQNEQVGTFMRLRVDSALVTSNPDLSDAYSALLDFAPHIIVAMTASEITKILPALETNWDTARSPAPFYIFSPDVFGSRSVADFAVSYGTSTRLLGFNYAGAEDTTIYDAYFSRLTTENNVDFPLEGTENYYDATYFMMYSLAAAASTGPITGRAVAESLPRLIAGTDEFEVGPQDVASVLNFLRLHPGDALRLLGTMGPPDFHLDTGVRTAEPSVYCIDDAGTFIQDAARYDAGADSLVGVPSCIEGFPQ